MALAGLAGCGGPSGGTPTGDLICRGEGTIVGGKVTFVKRLYNEQGLTGITVVNPVRYALVEIVLAMDDRTIASTYTNADGNYCVGVSAPADFPTVYPRVASTLAKPDYLKIVVHDDRTPPNLYSSRAASLDGSAPGVTYRDIAVPLTVRLVQGIDHPVSGAFNILDVLTTGTEKAVALTARLPEGTLFGVWRPGTYFGAGTEGTYFVGYDARAIGQGKDGYIVLSGGEDGGPDTGNHDEFDDDVILHEVGHFVAYTYSRPAEIGGTHYLNDHTQDIRLAWSEGWATFWSAAVRGKSSMVNTFGGAPGTPGHDLSYAFEIERPSSAVLSRVGTPLESHGIYTTSEVAVAAVLWDVFDGFSEPTGGDDLSKGLSAVWNIVQAFETDVPAPLPITLETFGSFFGFSTLKAVAKLRSIEFVRDQYEPNDNDPMTAVPFSSSETCHTLFPEGDVDYARLELGSQQTVTVETFNLTNGADTFLQILDSKQTVLQTNDDASDPDPKPAYRPTQCNQAIAVPGVYMSGPNNGQRFASRVSFPAGPGTYYVKVSAGTTHPEAGRLGGYGLSIVIQ